MTLPDRLTDAVTLDLGTRRWRLVMTYGVLLDCQEATGIDMLGTVDAFVRPSANVFRALLWSMLRRSDPSLSEWTVGDMIQPIDVNRIQNAIGEAFIASMPEPPTQKKADASATPEKPMTWMQTRSAARIELGLTDDEFLTETPRSFHALREASVEQKRWLELVGGTICESVVNYPYGVKNFMPRTKFMIHRFPEDEKPSVAPGSGDQLLDLFTKGLNG